jgi:hypothetical protein
VLLWYALDPSWKSWHVLPDPSGAPGRAAVQGQGSANLVIRRSLAEISATCVTADRFRVEAYAGGTRIGAADFTLDRPAAMPVRFPELNLVLCAPPNWRRWQQLPADSGVPDHPDDRMEDALFSAGDHPRPVLFLRAVPGPRSGRDLAADLDAAVHDVHADDWTRRRILDGDDCAAVARPGTLLTRAWRTTEGTAYVALAPITSDEPAETCQALASVSTYFYPLKPDPAPAAPSAP